MHKGNTQNNAVLQAMKSNGSILDPKDHEIDLQAVLSQQISINEVGIVFSEFQKQLILDRLEYSTLESLDHLPPAVIFMFEKIDSLSVHDSIEILREAQYEHSDDSNYPTEDYNFVTQLLEHQPSTTEYNEQSDNSIEKGIANEKVDVFEDYHDKISKLEIVDWELQVRIEAAIIAYYSPYPEVRAVTDPFDDPSIPCETFRSYLAAVIWTVIGSFVNEFFSHRLPSISLPASVVQLFLYPSGKLLEFILPHWSFTIPIPFFDNIQVDLNPGPWSIKEQQFASIFYSISSVPPYVDSNIYIQKLAVFYDNKWASFGYQVLLALSTQFIGFGFAGMLRKFVIYPVSAVWPTILPTLALNRALIVPERKQNINGWTISRYKFFFIVTVISFLYYWLPDFLFTALSTFNWLCWIAPDNFNLAAITGSNTGLGLNPIPTFDWNIISYGGNPLALPWYTQVNLYIGSLVGFVAIVGVYYSNAHWTAYLPINSNYLFDNQGQQYNTSAVIGANNDLDENLYKQYGPSYFSASNLVIYGAFFMLYLFAFFYQIIVEYKTMGSAMKSFYNGIVNWKKPIYDHYKDPQSRMMSKYKEVPDWCYFVVLLISFVLAILCVELYPTQTPVWGIVFTLVLNFVFLVPLTSILSITGFNFGLNVLVEIIVGYMFPGKYLPLITLKAFGLNTGEQSMSFVQDLKTGHYAKIPPRAIFRGQLISSIICAFMTLAVINFELSSVKDICTQSQPDGFSCPGEVTYYSSSIQFGLIGPGRFFDETYPILKWCFLIGFLLVFPAVALKWYGPKSISKFFQPTVLIGGVLIYAPYNLSYYTSGVYVSIAFMWYIKKRYLQWWEKYTYVLGGALQAGLAFSAIIIFFSVQYTNVNLVWWGNTVSNGGIEGGNGQQSLYNTTLLPNGYFGFGPGEFH